MVGRLLVCLVVAGCMQDPGVHCADGRLCPAGNVCDEVHALCILPEQTHACGSLRDGDVCTAAGKAGICDLGYCIPGCGDNVDSKDEECDDGNFASHDGCSSRCLIESAAWTPWLPAWAPRQGHQSAFAAFSDTPRLIVVGGANQQGYLPDQWERTANRTWRQITLAPSQRSFAAMAYDAGRHVVVMFGGLDTAERNDTWEYDGTTWKQRTPPQSPPARDQAVMVYDPGRARMVLFGGRTVDTLLSDTWEYDGTTWTEVTPTTSPPPRFLSSMAWDSADQRGVMFGGLGGAAYDDTWEYANGVWTEVTVSTKPNGRYGASLGDLVNAGKLVLFGGNVSSTQAASDTWEYTHASGWTAVTGQAVGPPARGYASFAFDPLVGALVLVGGAVAFNSNALDSVWEYNAAGWSDHTPVFSPSARSSRLVYDGEHDHVLMFGDYTGGLGAAETWVFDGAWQNVTPQSSTISPRYDHGLVYDAKHRHSVTFGSNIFFEGTETWFWDGAAWSNHTNATKPPLRSAPGMAYDSARGVIVMFGGRVGSTALDDTWELDGETWKQIVTTSHPPAQGVPMLAYDPISDQTMLLADDGTTWAYTTAGWHIAIEATSKSPPPRVTGAFLFDPNRQRVALYGGQDPSTSEFLADLWEIDGVTWRRVDQPGEGPPKRRIPQLAANRRAHGLLLFGGTGATQLADTWQLTYKSRTPDEDCTNSIDDDGDKHVDADDPDCQ